jgi:hypothetical protein
MSRRSAAAVATAALSRSHRAERWLVSLTGLVALVAGSLAVVVGQGWLGEFRAGRPVVDPVAVDFLGREPVLYRSAAIAIGVLLLVAGLLFLRRALRPERHPDLVLDDSSAQRLTVLSNALTEAVNSDCAQIDGVSRARARLVGDSGNPALRLNLWLREGSDLRAVWNEIESTVLSRARECLGVESLPTAVRVELDAAERQRVR